MKKEYNEIIPSDAIRVIETLNNSGYEAYLVGGCVRDMLMGVEPHDWDICTNATPEETKRVMNKHKIYTFDSGIKHGTITAVINGENYEVTTYRSEADYSDGRHPDKVEFITDIHEDLKRRDFTINAMAYNPLTNELIDDFNGHLDLKNGIIRAVGNASERFDEDSLRILRALRFAIKYQFNIDDYTSLSMHRQRELLVNISKERITDEVRKMLTSGKPVKVHFMEYKDIIGTIIPEIIPCFNFNQNNKYHKHDVYEHILYVVDNCNTTKFEIKMAALLHDIGKPKAYIEDMEGWGHFYGHPQISYEMSQGILRDDFRVSTEQLERTLELIQYHDMEVASTKASVKRALNKHGVDFMYDWFILKQADMDDHIYPNKNCHYIIDISGIEARIQQILDEQSCFSLKDLAIGGKDIMAKLGVKPGKHIGIILNTLLEEVIDEKISNESEILLNRAVEIYNDL